MRKVIVYCDRCKKEFEKWNHKRNELIGIGEIVYDTDDSYLDSQKDLCESCYTELENWWNFTAQEETEEIEELKADEDTEEEFRKAVEDIVRKGEDIV